MIGRLDILVGLMDLVHYFNEIRRNGRKQGKIERKGKEKEKEGKERKRKRKRKRKRRKKEPLFLM